MQLKIYLGVSEVNIKLEKPYDYYYELLFNQGVRLFKAVEINDNEKEYIFTRHNKEFKIKLKEIRNVGLVVSYVDYHNYNLTKEEQINNAIDYINEYGFAIENDIKNILM